MVSKDKISCPIHGNQETAYVCQHLAACLRTGVSVGFYIAIDGDDDRPDAWCGACEKHRIEEGGEWREDCNDYLKVKILCGSCYDRVKNMNEHGGISVNA